MNIIHIEGSHGTLSVHRESGHIVSAAKIHWVETPGTLSGDYVDGVADEYADIAFFDPATLTHSHLDILSVGFFTKAGHYEKPMLWAGEDDFWVEAERIVA